VIHLFPILVVFHFYFVHAENCIVPKLRPLNPQFFYLLLNCLGLIVAIVVAELGYSLQDDVHKFDIERRGEEKEEWCHLLLLLDRDIGQRPLCGLKQLHVRIFIVDVLDICLAVFRRRHDGLTNLKLERLRRRRTIRATGFFDHQFQVQLIGVAIIVIKIVKMCLVDLTLFAEEDSHAGRLDIALDDLKHSGLHQS